MSKTDMQKFIELYSSFGVHVEPVRHSMKYNSAFHPFYTEDVAWKIVLHEDMPKMGGYYDFYTEVYFDEGGTFLWQGVWE